MDIEPLGLRSRVPVTLCRDMPAACSANLAEAERGIPHAERELYAATDAVRDWVESDGPAEKSRRADSKRYWQDQGYKHRSDKRHWLLQAQSWRKFLLVHPECSSEPAGSKCSHGYVSPMCAVDAPVLKEVERSRVPGDGDPDE